MSDQVKGTDPVYQQIIDRFPHELEMDSREGYSGLIVSADQLISFVEDIKNELGYDFLTSVTGVDYFPEEILEGGGRVTHAVELGQGNMAITVQYLHPSEIAAKQLGWRGIGGSAEPTSRDTVTVMGRDAFRNTWTHEDAVKAVEVSYSDPERDLALLITLHENLKPVADPFDLATAETVPDSTLVELDRILNSFTTVQ